MKNSPRSLLYLIVVALPVAAGQAIVASPPKPIPHEPAFLSGRESAVWVSNRASVFRKSPSGPRVHPIGLGDPFEIIEQNGGHLKTRDDSGNVGWLRKSDTSSIWILVEKEKRMLTFFDMRKTLDQWRVDLGPDPVGDKAKRGDLEPGHYRTPEGEFYVSRKVPNSRFYRAFLISYPDIEDADRGLKEGLITRSQHIAIVRAIKSKRVPPQNTRLGGFIEIHGNGTGGLYDWTLGCVAVKNKAMDDMWDMVKIGTPVVIVP